MARFMILVVFLSCVLSGSASRDTDTLTVDESGTTHPPVCDAAIVADTCGIFNRRTKSYYNSAVDRSQAHLHAAEIAEGLGVEKASVVAFLESIGVENIETAELQAAGAYGVTCQELCEKAVASIPAGHRPPTSDVACYLPLHADEAVCNVDVSDDELGGFTFDVDPKRAARIEMPAHPDERIVHPIKGTDLVAVDDESHEGGEPDLHNKANIEEMRRLIANMFRVYPPFQISVLDTEEGSEQGLEAADVAESAFVEVHDELPWDSPTGPKPDCSKVKGAVLRTNRWWHSNELCKCEDGMNLQSLSTKNRKRCREQGENFDPATMPSDCYCWPAGEFPAPCVDHKPSGIRRRDGSNVPCSSSQAKAQCSEKHVQDACPFTCGRSCRPKPGTSPPGSWQRDVLEVAVKAQAYTSRALRAMAKGGADGAMKRWFGSKPHKVEAKRVLTGVLQVLGNIDYVFPGTKCSNTTYAYVYPTFPLNKNRHGQFVFHLCQVYMEVDLGEQIEALTHEASHHKSMFRDDVCMPGSKGSSGDDDKLRWLPTFLRAQMTECEKAYGRSDCMQLARKNSDAAIQNADSICYFINDAAEGK